VGKPPVFLVDRLGVLGGARQAYRHAGAEVEGPVVPAALGDRLDRQFGPVRELGGDEAAYLLHVDDDAFGRRAEIRGAVGPGP
jgi:hypothetical protein